MTRTPPKILLLDGIGGVPLGRELCEALSAEGVETVEQGEKLLQLGCTLAQGYCVARPMPVQAFMDWAVQWQAPKAWKIAGATEADTKTETKTEVGSLH